MTQASRVSDHPVEPLFVQRWSPRAFTDEAIPQETLMSLFEAARWAPSSFNLQPWRFIWARRGEAGWDELLGLLVPGNQAWASRAAALVFLASAKFRPGADGSRAETYSHSFDAGAAWMSLALQAHAMGWAVHGMTGFDHARSYEALGVPAEDYRVEAAIAIGRQGDPASLPEAYRAREAPSGRNPATSFAFEGRFGKQKT